MTRSMDGMHDDATRADTTRGREAEMLRVYLGESDRVDGHPAAERVLLEARRAGLAGATVLRGTLGFGANSVVHRPNAFRLSGDLPLVIEIVDRAEAVEAFLPRLEALLRGGGLITRERVRIVRYGPDAPAGDGSADAGAADDRAADGGEADGGAADYAAREDRADGGGANGGGAEGRS